MSDSDKVCILVPGKIHPHVRERIDAAFDVVSIERSDPALISQQMADSVRGIACATRIDAAFIDALPQLEIISSFGVGYDSVDAGHAASRGIIVTNTPDVLSDEVADTTIGLLLNTLRELPKAEWYLRKGQWAKNGSYPLTRLTLRERTVGIYGLGRIGLAIARRLEAFGVDVIYHSRNKRDDVDYPYVGSLQELAQACDTLIVSVPGSAQTQNKVNAEVFAALGSDGVLINIGRGSTVDSDALATALKSGTIAAAGLDVYPDEPHVPESLLELQNTSLLPHVGSASVHTRNAMAGLVVDNLVSWFNNGRALTPVQESLTGVLHESR